MKYETDGIHGKLVDGVFVAVGQIPESNLFDEVQKTSNGYVITDEKIRTDIDGIFAVGDVRDKALRQVVTACADGAIAGAICAQEA